MSRGRTLCGVTLCLLTAAVCLPAQSSRPRHPRRPVRVQRPAAIVEMSPPEGAGVPVFTNLEDGGASVPTPPSTPTPIPALRPVAMARTARVQRVGVAAASQAAAGSPAPVGELLDRAAARYQVNPHLVRAVARQESDFDPRAVSDKGAVGVMQLMPATARILGVRHPFNPAENIDGGVRFLRDMLARYHGDARLALAAYNAGPGSVDRFGGTVPPFVETQAYVRHVMSELSGAAAVHKANGWLSGHIQPAAILTVSTGEGTPSFSNLP